MKRALQAINEMFVPLHHYLFQALDIMFDHLSSGAALPPSQVVHTVPRGPGAPPLAAENVPDIAANPGPGSAITFNAGILHIPD